MNDDLATMTPEQLRLEIKRNARKNTKRASAALDLWMLRTGMTVEKVSAIISDRLRAAVKRSDERLARKYGRLN